MSDISIVAEKRDIIGSRKVKALRKEGKIPAVVYGKGDETFYISIDEWDFNKKFSHISENVLIDLKVGSDLYSVLIKDYQYNQLKSKMMHIDFQLVHTGSKISTRVHVKLEGRPVGVKEGGTLEQAVNELRISCFPKDMPTEILINIEDLKIGDSYHVYDIKGYDNIEILTPENEVVAQVLGKIEDSLDASEDGEEVVEEVGSEEE